MKHIFGYFLTHPPITLVPKAFETRVSSRYLKMQFLSHRKRTVSSTKTNQIIMFRERTACYSDNHMEHVNTILGQNGKFFNVKRVTYSVTSVVKGAEKEGRI